MSRKRRGQRKKRSKGKGRGPAAAAPASPPAESPKAETASSEAKATTEPEQPKPEKDTEPEKDTKSEPEKDTESKKDTKSESEPEKDSESEPEKDSESESEPEKDSESEPEKDSESESEPEKDSESEPEKDSESEPEKDSESEPEKDSESEPEKDSESEPEEDAESEPSEDADDGQPARARAKLSAASSKLAADDVPSKGTSKQPSKADTGRYDKPSSAEDGKLQRRAFERAPVKTKIGLATESNLYTGLTNDISEGGVFVATHRMLPIGTEIDLQISFADVGGPEFETRAVVRWIRDESAGDGDPGMGVCFVELDDDKREWIQSFVESRRQPLLFESELQAKSTRSEREQAEADLVDVRGSRLTGFLIFGAAIVALALVAAYLFGAL